MEAKKLRLLAVTTPTRADGFPDVPTMKELGYDVTYYLWVGLFAPKGTPAPIVAAWTAAVDKVGTSKQFIDPLVNIGLEPSYLPQAEFAKFWEEDGKRSDEAVRQIGKVQG